MMQAQPNKETLRISYDKQNKEWRMGAGMGHAQPPANYPKLSVEYNNQGEFKFLIVNPKDAVFAKQDPFVAKPTKSSPNDFKKQFTVTGGGTDQLMVKVANSNGDGTPYAGGDYHYELRFEGGLPALDPTISNGGCCQDKSSSALLITVGVIALLALAYLVIRPMLAKR